MSAKKRWNASFIFSTPTLNSSSNFSYSSARRVSRDVAVLVRSSTSRARKVSRSPASLNSCAISSPPAPRSSNFIFMRSRRFLRSSCAHLSLGSSTGAPYSCASRPASTRDSCNSSLNSRVINSKRSLSRRTRSSTCSAAARCDLRSKSSRSCSREVFPASSICRSRLRTRSASCPSRLRISARALSISSFSARTFSRFSRAFSCTPLIRERKERTNSRTLMSAKRMA